MPARYCGATPPEWFEAEKRRKAGGNAGFPRRKRALLAVRWYHGTFRIDGDRLRVPVARGAPPLVVRLGRAVPYPQDSIRLVGGCFQEEVTAALHAFVGRRRSSE